MEQQYDELGPLPPHRVENGKIVWLPGSGAGFAGVNFLNKKYSERILGVKPNTTVEDVAGKLSRQNIQTSMGVPRAPEKSRRRPVDRTGGTTLNFSGGARKTKRRMHRNRRRTHSRKA